MKIAIFDSGLGGITVMHEALKLLPNEDYLYYADTDHVPYGTKPKEDVRKYVLEAADFLVGQGAKAMVVACNTATSVAIEELRKRYNIPIIGMEPAVKPAVAIGCQVNKRVLVTATPLTLKEEKMQRLLKQVDDGHLTDLLPLPKLVEFAEQYNFNGPEVKDYLKEELNKFPLDRYCTMVLGCTHFHYFKDTIREIVPKDINIIDGNKGTVNNMYHQLAIGDLLEQGKGNIDYYISGRLVDDKTQLERYNQLLERLNRLSLLGNRK